MRNRISSGHAEHNRLSCILCTKLWLCPSSNSSYSPNQSKQDTSTSSSTNQYKTPPSPSCTIQTKVIKLYKTIKFLWSIYVFMIVHRKSSKRSHQFTQGTCVHMFWRHDLSGTICYRFFWHCTKWIHIREKKGGVTRCGKIQRFLIHVLAHGLERDQRKCLRLSPKTFTHKSCVLYKVQRNQVMTTLHKTNQIIRIF